MKKLLLALFLLPTLMSVASSQTIWMPTRTVFPDSAHFYEGGLDTLPSNFSRYVTITAEAALGTDTLYFSTNDNPRSTGEWLLKGGYNRFPCENTGQIRIFSNATGYILRYKWER